MALTRLERADQPVAAQAVVEALGRLPAPLHAKLVRLIYRRRYFALIASVLPGPRKAHYVKESESFQRFRCYRSRTASAWPLVF